MIHEIRHVALVGIQVHVAHSISEILRDGSVLIGFTKILVYGVVILTVPRISDIGVVDPMHPIRFGIIHKIAIMSIIVLSGIVRKINRMKIRMTQHLCAIEWITQVAVILFT